MDRFLVVLLGLPISVVIIYFRRQIGDFMGRVDFAESILGSGGTYTLVLIIGFLAFVLSLMYGFGTLQSFFSSFAGPLFGR